MVTSQFVCAWSNEYSKAIEIQATEVLHELDCSGFRRVQTCLKLAGCSNVALINCSTSIQQSQCHHVRCTSSHTYIVCSKDRQIGTQDLEEMGQCFCIALCQLEKHPNPKALTEKDSVRSKKGMKTAPEPSDSESERYNSIAWRKPSLMDYRGHILFICPASHTPTYTTAYPYTFIQWWWRRQYQCQFYRGRHRHLTMLSLWWYIWFHWHSFCWMEKSG